MARGTTLVKLLDMYRAECRLSLNPAHNPQMRDTQVNHIQRVQTRLWDDYNWPHLTVERFLQVQNGQRYYAPPSDVHVDRVHSIFIKYEGEYRKLSGEITEQQLSVHDSDLDEREWPPRAWRISEDEQIEVWPVPNTDYDTETQDGALKIYGTRDLRPLVDDSDRADLDDYLIVLYCAAEYLAAQGAKDAPLKNQQALQRLGRLRGQQETRKVFSMRAGLPGPSMSQRVPFAVHRRST